jgi:hypothetical protein
MKESLKLHSQPRLVELYSSQTDSNLGQNNLKKQLNDAEKKGNKKISLHFRSIYFKYVWFVEKSCCFIQKIQQSSSRLLYSDRNYS